MSKRLISRWQVVLVSLLSAALLAGCITTLAPTQMLPRGAHASVSEVAIAVGANGYKHYAWTECSGEAETLTCSLVYSRVSTGAVVYSYGFVQAGGEFARYPDVAVSSTGDAYVVWSECTDFNNCFDFWTMFPAADPESVEPVSELLHTSAVKSEGPPVIVARGDDVYAAYFILSSGFPRLRYRQLVGAVTLRSGLIDNTTLNPITPSLVVDSDGNLHAVWVRNPVTDTFVATADNTGGVSDFHAATTFEGGLDKIITSPDIALDDDDRPYLAYGINNGSDDTIRVQCVYTAASCYRGVNQLTVPQVIGPWNVYGNVHLELIGEQPNVVFAATNNIDTFYEVWWYRPPEIGPDGPPSAVTNTNNTSEGEPLIVEESSLNDVPVVGWRQFHFDLSAQGPAGLSDGFCYGDVFVKFASEATRRVFTDRDTCDNIGLDMASNGAWVAGVWVDEDPDVLEYHAAWTSFNALVTYLPITNR